MGGSLSRASKSMFGGGGAGESGAADPRRPATGAVTRVRGATALVFTRHGSMYFDEDDDLAHEFFEQVPARAPGRTCMRRVSARKLRPQGRVKYRFPRLHVDFPIILYHD